MVGLSKRFAHDSVDHGIDTAVEPGEVCTDHVQHRWDVVVFMYVEQHVWDIADHKTQENS